MSRTQKILTTMLWGLLVLIMVSVIGAGWWKRGGQPEYTSHGYLTVQPVAAPQRGDVYFKVPQFALIDQNSEPVTDQTFRGKPWVAAFIFTSCAGPCPMMSSNMARLQERAPHGDLKLVSFTVDPQRDTPAVLKRYAQTYNADDERWSFLTGSPEAMAAVARGMLMPFAPASESADITHSTKFLLIDAAGDVRGIYAADEMEALATDAAKLATGEAASAAASPPTTQPGIR